MFGLDPFSRPAAIIEILLLLALAAFVGWLLGRWARAGRVRTLRVAIADKKAELETCRSEKTGSLTTNDTVVTKSMPTLGADTINVTEPQPVLETPPLFIPADPLLPAYSHDDTPALVTAEPAPPIDDALPSISSTLEFPPIEEAVLAKATPVVDAAPAITSVDDRETAVLNRIAARATDLNFDRIGRASATEADDLKDIVGVGPFLERKLHSLGIYTFRQIASFTKEDAHKVNELIEFFPGRIEGDNWVGQAKAFYERKYGRQ